MEGQVGRIILEVYPGRGWSCRILEEATPTKRFLPLVAVVITDSGNDLPPVSFCVDVYECGVLDFQPLMRDGVMEAESCAWQYRVIKRIATTDWEKEGARVNERILWEPFPSS